MAPKGPYKLCTVNTAPERAKHIIGRAVVDLQDSYIIDYAGNAETIESVKDMCERNKPDFLFCASMWTPEESEEIQRIAKETVPSIKTMAIPQGLQAEKGPEAVVEYLKAKVPELIES